MLERSQSAGNTMLLAHDCHKPNYCSEIVAIAMIRSQIGQFDGYLMLNNDPTWTFVSHQFVVDGESPIHQTGIVRLDVRTHSHIHDKGYHLKKSRLNLTASGFIDVV